MVFCCGGNDDKDETEKIKGENGHRRSRSESPSRKHGTKGGGHRSKSQSRKGLYGATKNTSSISSEDDNTMNGVASSPPKSPAFNRATKARASAHKRNRVSPGHNGFRKAQSLEHLPNGRSRDPSRGKPANKKANARSRSIEGAKAKAPPAKTVPEALKLLAHEDWEQKVSGMAIISNFAQHNVSQLLPHRQDMITQMIAEAKNLRSSVSKQALTTFGHLFTGMGKSLDPDIERIVPVLMMKTGDPSSAFIREDAERGLENMVDNCSPSKSLSSLVAAGANSKNTTVRSACASLIYRLTEQVGPAKILSNKDMAEKMMTTAAQFSSDQQPAPRYHGKVILVTLRKDKQFDKVLNGLSGNVKKKITDVIDSVDTKGMGSAPGSSTGTRSRPNLTPGGATGLSRSNSSRRPTGRVSDKAQADMDDLRSRLNANDWERRDAAFDDFLHSTKSQPRQVCTNLKLMEAYTARLNDINSKVALHALEILPKVLDNLGSQVGEAKGLVSDMVKALVAQLPSKNSDIQKQAKKDLDSMANHIDSDKLLPAFASAAKSGNVKQKPQILPRLGRICQDCYRSRAQSVNLQALPVLWDLLKANQGDGELKKSTANYARTLADLMGTKHLLDAAQKHLNENQLTSLRNMID